MEVFEYINFGGPAFFRNDAYYYGKLISTGSVSHAYVEKTGAYTVTENDHVINATSGTFTITLPTAVGISGRVYVFKNSGTGDITIDASGSQTIDGSLTVKMLRGLSGVTIQSNGSNWIIIGVISPIQMSNP